jgi:hypothetical protein
VSVINTNRGQALAESVLLLPLLLVVIIAVMWFCRIVITRQQLVSAVRYGTDMIVHTTLSEQQIRREIRNYLTHHWHRGRTLDPDRLQDEDIAVVINDFPAVDVTLKAYIQKPGALRQVLAETVNPLARVSMVEIRYAYAVPPFLRFMGRESLSVSARSAVLSGTGCRNRLHERGIDTTRR